MPPQHDRRSGPPRRLPARKRWGQHFLASDAVAERIVEAARVGETDTVLESGRGDGALTRPRAARAAFLAAVEIDPRRAEVLAEQYASSPRVRVFCGAVLPRPFSECAPAG